MSVRSARIKALIEQSQKSYVELEKITGIKKSSLQRYASGATTKIPLDVIEKLSKAFNVSQEYLMGWEEEITNPEEPKLSEVELMLLEIFRLIPEDQQQYFLEMGRLYASSLKKD
jgi:transcriptional regulator with XRE-family HTH domain